jgi:hypothetical protein
MRKESRDSRQANYDNFMIITIHGGDLLFRSLPCIIQSLTNLIGVDDVVQMIVNPATQIDVNQDGFFNREDIVILLGQISMH